MLAPVANAKAPRRTTLTSLTASRPLLDLTDMRLRSV